MKTFIFLIILMFNILIACSSENMTDTTRKQKTKYDYVSLPNPLACYAEQLGYSYIIRDTLDNKTWYGLVLLPNGMEVNPLKFYSGEIYPEYSYCARRGGHHTILDTALSEGYKYVCPFCVDYDSQNQIIWKMNMGDYMELYGDTLCNGVPFYFGPAKK